MFLTESLKNADIYVGGDKLQSSSKEISSRISDALGKLVLSVYHKLSYIDTATNENDVRAIFKESAQITIDGADSKKNELALNDLKNYIALNTERHMKTSMKSLLERFMKAPYGFIEADIQWLVAKLFKMGEIALFVNNEAVSTLSNNDEEIIRFIVRKEYAEKLMTEKKTRSSEKQKKAVREVMKELFNSAPTSDDDDAIMKSFLDYTRALKTDLEKLEIHYSTEPAYPGKRLVLDGKRMLNDVLQMKYSAEFFAGIDSNKDDYLDFAEDYEPLKKFFAGDQKTIFDKALHLMEIYDDSKTFIVDSQIEAVVGDIKAILKKTAPYGEIFKLNDLLEKYIRLYSGLLDAMQAPVDAAIEEAKERVFAELEGKKCHSDLSNTFIVKFNELKDKAASCNNVATLQNIKIEADTLKVRCLNEINKEEAKIIAEEQAANDAGSNDTGDTDTPAVPVQPVKKKKTVSIKSINNAATWQIESEADVKRYLAELEQKLISALEDDTVINVEF